MFVVPFAPVALEVEAALAEEAAVLGERYMKEVFERHEVFWLEHWDGRVRHMEALLGGPGRLLDIGCALGHFQAAAQRRGWQTVGVEISAEQADYARKRFGLEVHTGRFEQTNLVPGSFDAVTLWSVIEHVSEPLAFLRKVRRLLRPGGVLGLQTPNSLSLVTSLADLGYHLTRGRYLLGVYSLDHVFRFDDPSLRRLLASAGYSRVHVEHYDNLRVMRLRMSLQPHALLRRLLLRLTHHAAAWTARRNQLVAYARVAGTNEGDRQP